MLIKMIDDNGGINFDATTDSLERISTALGTTIKLSDTIDGVSVSVILEVLMAMANGRFAKNVPSAGYYTFYKRDNTTPLFVMYADDAGRTRS
jgi:hypothetical protein